MKDLDATKIDQPELREFAQAEGGSQRREVIIELGGPVPKVTLRKPKRSPSVPMGERPEILSFGDDSGQAEAMDRLEKELGELGLGKQPVRLDSAQAFVASVTPEQLCRITRLPLVGVIRPNRTHRAPGRSCGS
jgi:hypothetical protein